MVQFAFCRDSPLLQCIPILSITSCASEASASITAHRWRRWRNSLMCFLLSKKLLLLYLWSRAPSSNCYYLWNKMTSTSNNLAMQIQKGGTGGTENRAKWHWCSQIGPCEGPRFAPACFSLVLQVTCWFMCPLFSYMYSFKVVIIHRPVAVLHVFVCCFNSQEVPDFYTNMPKHWSGPWMARKTPTSHNKRVTCCNQSTDDFIPFCCLFFELLLFYKCKDQLLAKPSHHTINQPMNADISLSDLQMITNDTNELWSCNVQGIFGSFGERPDLDLPSTETMWDPCGM